MRRSSSDSATATILSFVICLVLSTHCIGAELGQSPWLRSHYNDGNNCHEFGHIEEIAKIELESLSAHTWYSSEQIAFGRVTAGYRYWVKATLIGTTLLFGARVSYR